MRTLLFILSFLSSITAAPLRTDIYPRAQIAPFRGQSTVRVRIIVERDVRNRAIGWAWDSDDCSGQTVKQLDGDASQRVFTIFIEHLLAGHYEFTATLFRTDGQVTITDRFDIVPPGDSQ